jgi:hypothetical protein
MAARCSFVRVLGVLPRYSSSSAARRRSSAALIGCVYGASDVSFASVGSAGAWVMRVGMDVVFVVPGVSTFGAGAEAGAAGDDGAAGDAWAVGTSLAGVRLTCASAEVGVGVATADDAGRSVLRAGVTRSESPNALVTASSSTTSVS